MAQPQSPLSKESTLETMSEFIKVATLDEIPVNGSKRVEVEDVEIALFNLNGEIYAIENICTHDGGSLGDGTIVNGHEVECPRHGARFDICTGAALRMPAFEPTTSYDVRIEGQDVLIESPL